MPANNNIIIIHKLYVKTNLKQLYNHYLDSKRVGDFTKQLLSFYAYQKTNYLIASNSYIL